MRARSSEWLRHERGRVRDDGDLACCSGAALVSACLRKETTDAHHIIGFAKPTRRRHGSAAASGPSQPERIRSVWYATAARHSGCREQPRATRTVGLSRGRRCRQSGRMRRGVHCKSIPSAVARMLVLASGDPRDHACHDDGWVRAGPRRDRDPFNTAPTARVIAQSCVNFCEDGEFIGSRLVRTPNRRALKSSAAYLDRGRYRAGHSGLRACTRFGSKE
jgi:hypothetical protein